MMRLIVVLLVSLPLFSSCAHAVDRSGAVLTADAAIAKAQQAWDSIHDKVQRPAYSKEQTSRFKPYTAILENGVWHVRGTVPANYHGEVLETTVRQSDGSVAVDVVQVK